MRNRTAVLIIMCCSFSVLWEGCKSAKKTASSSSLQKTEATETISLSINEMMHFEFQKHDSTWTGTFTVYTLENDQKVADKKFVAAEDSSWKDFDLFVDYLKLYEISPQHELDGWAPNSGTLPSRVYSFEVFDGDTTRTYSYQDPINDIKDYWQSQNVLTFITFVENDLRWRKLENIE